MSLAPYLRILARGQGHARSVPSNEVSKAVTLTMREDATLEAVGQIPMSMRTKGKTSDKIAGFAEAEHTAFPGFGPAPAPLEGAHT